jgi:predicted DCC family thiol-disulfide oxidoreductase YuxK
MRSASSTREPEWIYFDGTCGLCHGWVKFVLARDPGGTLFRFAPLDGNRYRQHVHVLAPEKRPDSIVVVTSDNLVLHRSTAVAYILRQLGGIWGRMGILLLYIPRPIRDVGYRFVAATRHWLVARPPDVCPVVPRSLQGRFDT